MPTSSIIVVILVFIAGLLSGGLFISWMMSRRKSAKILSPSARSGHQEKSDALVFHPSYVIWPALVCVTSIITAVSFNPFLPAKLAFRFDSNGFPAIYMSKYAYIFIMLTLQIISVAVAWGVAGIVVRMGKSAFQTSRPQLKLNDIVSLMCNMILLPQVILAYILIDSLIYGVSSRHMFSVGIYSMLTLAIGSMVIIIAFIRVISQARNVINKQ